MKNLLSVLFICIIFFACSTKRPKVDKETIPSHLVEMELEIKGMHCDDCETSIQTGVKELPGVDSISANYEDSTAYVRFDSTKTNVKQIAEAISKRGFEVKL